MKNFLRELKLMHPLLNKRICEIEEFNRNSSQEKVAIRIKDLADCIEEKEADSLYNSILLDLAFELWLLRTLLISRIENSN